MRREIPSWRGHRRFIEALENRFLLSAAVGTVANLSGAVSPAAVATDPFVPGKLANALAFDGETSFADMGNPPDGHLDIGSIATLEMWVKFNALPLNNFATFASKDVGGGSQNKWIFGYANNYGGVSNATFFHINTPGTGPVFLQSTAWTPVVGTWYQIALVKSGANFTFYLNGTADGTATCTIAVPQAGADFMLGEAENSFLFNGDLDDVRVWNIARSSQQILNSFASELVGNEPGLVGYWKMNESEGSTVSDSSPFGTNGVLTGVSPSYASGWQAIGPTDVPFGAGTVGVGKLQAFAVDYANPLIMYAGGGYGPANWGPGAQSGVFKSTDGGNNWTAINAGLPNPSITALWLDQANPDIVLAATWSGGIFRTTDAGQTWTLSQPTSIVDSFLQVGHTLYAAAGPGVEQSTDAGATWTITNLGGGVSALAASGTALYAGLYDGDLCYRSSPSAAFQKIFSQTGHTVQSIAIDPNVPSTIYAVEWAGYQPSLYVTHDAGASWTLLFPPGVNNGVQVVSVDSAGTVYVGLDNSFDISTDQGATWRVAPNAPWDTKFILPWPGQIGKVVLGTDQGLYITADSGNTWADLNGKIMSSLLTGLSVNGSTIITAVQDYSPIASFDGGANWHQVAYSEDGVVRINPGNPNYVYAFTSGGLQYSSDGGHAFATISIVPSDNFSSDDHDVIANVGAHDTLNIDPENPSTIYAAATDGVYRSIDWGVDWTKMPWNFTNVSLVVVSPSDSSTIFVGVSGGSLSVTHNGGATWTSCTLPSGTGYPTALAVDPTNPAIVEAGGNNASSNAATLLLSTDGGNTFADYSAGMELGALNVNALAFNPASSYGAAAVATGNGVYFSIAPGERWTEISGNAVPRGFTDLQWVGSYLYAATYGEGIVRLANADPGLAPAAKLATGQMPPGVSVGQTISATLRVFVENTDGDTVASDDSSVSVAIASGPAGAALGGTLQVPAMSGIATFDNLTLNLPGVYTLRFSDGSLVGAISASLTVLGPATKLAFGPLPSAAVAGAAFLPAVNVYVEDAGNNVVSSDNSTVLLNIVSGPAGAALGGAVSATVMNGVATFPDLSLSQPGTYMLRAADGVLSAGLSAAFTVASPASFAGVAYGDTNGNGTRDSGETGVSGITAFLDANGNGVLDAGELSAITDSSGAYSFPVVFPGSYSVQIQLPSGWLRTDDSSSIKFTVGGDVIISNLDLGLQGVLTPNFGGPYSAVEGASVTLSASNSSEVGGTITKYEWDTNYNGSTFVARATGITVPFSAVGLDGPSTRNIALRVTDASGATSVATGSISITNAPPTATFSSGGSVTQGNSGTVSFTNSTDPSPADITAGFKYSYDFNNDGTFDTVDSTSSSATVASSYLSTIGSHTIKGRIKDKDGGFTDYTTTITVIAASTGTITGTVYNDANGNGVLDSGETTVSGQKMFLDLNRDAVLQSNEPTFTTGANGVFTFSGLTAGTYRVRMTQLSGYTWTAPTSGYYEVTVPAGQTVTTKNYLEKKSTSLTASSAVAIPRATISGTIFQDTNGNGREDGGERGLGGWLVYLDLNNDGTLDAGDVRFTTDANGAYRFNVTAGKYTVREVVKSGFQRSSPAAAAFSITLAAGQSVSGKNFGDRR